MEKVTNAQDMDLDVSLGQGPANELINKIGQPRCRPGLLS
jgi:hypothetical protein